MKAVLVIDEMPSSCNGCDFNRFASTHWGCSRCGNKDVSLYMKNTTRAEWCPLKPLPTKITTATLSEREQESTELLTSMALLKTYADGWNDCLKGITDD